jgi:hypothetical protein
MTYNFERNNEENAAVFSDAMAFGPVNMHPYFRGN